MTHYKDVVAAIPSMLTGLAALSFISAALVEWAFYVWLGSNLIYLVTPLDIASASIAHIPFILLFVSIIAFQFFYTISRGTGGILFFIVVVIFISSASYALDTSFKPGILGVMLLIAFSVSLWWIHRVCRRRIESKELWIAIYAVLFFIVLVSMSLGLGVLLAAGELSTPSAKYRIVHFDGSKEEGIQLLKAMSKGVLVLRIPGKEVVFMNYHSFKRIEWLGVAEGPPVVME